MRLLYGIPAYRLQGHVGNCLFSTTSTPADVLVIDNNADRSVKEEIARYPRAIVIRNAHNNYCNGAWNQILEYGIRNQYDVIALGTDAMPHTGWYDTVNKRFSEFKKEVVSPIEARQVLTPDHTVVHHEWPCGQIFFLTLEAAKKVYPIPECLRHWFGDNYIFDKLAYLGWRMISLRDLTMDVQSQGAVTVSASQHGEPIGPVIEADKKAWAENSATWRLKWSTEN